MDNHILRVEGSLGKEECEKMRNIFHDKRISQFKDKGPKNKYCKDRNIYYYEFISVNVATSPFLKSLQSGLKIYIDKYSFLKTRAFEISDVCNIQRYKPGKSYSREHDENSSGLVSESFRMLAWMFYLNTVENGGGTCFPQQDLKVKAREGDLYIWPAGWTHSHYGLYSEVSEKYIITGWCNYLNEKQREMKLNTTLNL